MAYRAVLKILISFSIASLINADNGDDDNRCNHLNYPAKVSSYYSCLQEEQKVFMNKPIEGNMSEPCKNDRDRIKVCYKAQIWKELDECKKYEVEIKLHTRLVDVDLGRLEFMCNGNGKNIKQFWENKGAECFEKSKVRYRQSDCANHLPEAHDTDLNNHETCEKMLRFLACVRYHIDEEACDDFGKKMVYTYWKSGYLKTICGHYIKEIDSKDLDINYEESCFGSSVGAVSASFPFVVFCLCKSLILN